VLMVVGSDRIADGIADHLPGIHAHVALADVLQGNLIKAFDEPPDFNLCICTLGPGELKHFSDIIRTVRPCMPGGGKIVGFYPNFGIGEIPTDAIELLEGLSSAWSTRIHYAGSEKSARIVRRFHGILTEGGKGRVASLARIAMTLLIASPSVLAANRLEAAASEEPSSRSRPHCTSITIDVTV